MISWLIIEPSLAKASLFLFGRAATWLLFCLALANKSWPRFQRDLAVSNSVMAAALHLTFIALAQTRYQELPWCLHVSDLLRQQAGK